MSLLAPPAVTATRRTGVPAGATAVAVLAVLVTAAQPYGGEVVGITLAAALALLVLPALPRTASTRVPLPVVLLLLWTAWSCTWSAVPVRSLVALAQLVVLTALGVLVATRHTLEQLVRLVATALSALLAVSLVVYVALPARGRTLGAYQAGTLEGVFAHRNLAGYVATLAAVTCAVLVLQEPRGSVARRAGLAGLALALLCVHLTSSRTTLLTLGVVSLAAWGLRRLARLPRRTASRVLLALAAALALGAYAALRNVAELATGLGRDATLTGRTDIWPAVVEQVRQQPVTGYGWGALWQEGTEPTQSLWDRAGFVFFHAHDGYLDVALQTGLVGLALTLAVAGVATWRAVRLALSSDRPVHVWPAAVLLCLLLVNTTESVLHQHIGWLLLVVISTRLLPAQGTAAPDDPSASRAHPAPSLSRT